MQPHSRKAQLVVLTLAHFFVDMSGGFLMPLIPVLRKHVGTELWVMTVLTGVCGVLVNGIQPLVGMITPLLRRPMFLLAGPVLAMAMALIGTTHSFWLVFLFAVVGKIGIGAFHPDALMAAHAISGSKEHLVIPVFLSGGYFGWSFGALISTQWQHCFGFRGFWLLGAPGLLFVAAFVLTGLHKEEIKQRGHAVNGDPGARGTNFALLFSLASVMITAIVVLFTFLNVELDVRFGKDGVTWGGRALAVLGLSSVFGSYFWGYMSKRVSPMLLVAVGQFMAAGVYPVLIGAGSPERLVVLSLPAGLCMGMAFFPVIVTVARRSRGLTPALRAGLIIGGTWGVASVAAMVCGYLTRHGVAVRSILRAMEWPILASAVMALLIYLAERRRKAVSQS